ncbi:MAG: hypothetical protein KKD01_01760 [Proteobacteria bacterium]|nr:hypothetical protein [Pseudomonadota bacterium]MBU1139443.1 hypothetical protein [Pseudomonadota bacterium]MBU1233090.1 hypothetical protein [Pseudomonadota bacterium]MBU1419634.1 hypothetical protein [Pseudomonadota bacterium]MBU1453426.1 hypothetical protein [Pseudomonadota bacterium]
MGKTLSRKKNSTKNKGKKKNPARLLLVATLFCLSGLSLLSMPLYVSAEQESVQEEVSEVSVTDGQEIPGQMEERVVAEHTPGSPEEELIYDFLDWMLYSFSTVAEGLDLILEVDGNYSISRAGENYEVRLDPFLLYIDDNVVVNFSPVIFTCQPQGKDKLRVQMLLPRKLPVLNSGKIVAEVSIAGQQISGVWDRGMEFFDHADLKLDEVVLRDTKGNSRLSVQQLVLGSILSHDAKGLWQEKYQGMLTGASFNDGKLNLTVGNIRLLSELSGENYGTYIDIKKTYLSMADTFAEMELHEAKDFWAMADTYLQLLISSESQVSIEGVVIDEGDIIRLDGLEFFELLQKNPQTNTFKMDGKGHVLGFFFVEQASEENPRPLSLNLKQITFADSVELNPIPQTLFADMGNALEKAGLLEDEEAVDNYLADEGLNFFRKILALIAGGSMDISLNDATVNNFMDQPVSLGAVTLGGRFAAGTGTGGKVNVLAGFSGLNGMGQGDITIPQAARLNFALENIPSLLNLISDPSSLAEGDMDEVQGQVMMNGVSMFMTSPLLLSLTDSFIAFPTSRLNLDLTAHVDNAAKFLSTGSMKMVMENPDEFIQVARAFGADEDMQKILTMLSALSDRSNENGKVVDRLHAEINQEGKVFANQKDVTLLFFPEQVVNTEVQETTSEETQPPVQSN